MHNIEPKPQPQPRINRYLTSLDEKHPRLRIPAKAKRYTDAQYGILLKAPTLLNTILLGKYGLVQSNFGLAEIANRMGGRFVETVHYADMSEADVAAFVSHMRKTAARNGWPDEMLEIEFQFLPHR